MNQQSNSMINEQNIFIQQPNQSIINQQNQSLIINPQPTINTNPFQHQFFLSKSISSTRWE